MAPTPWTDETHSGPAPDRKPRRLGLWLPWAAVLILAAVWSLAWVWLMRETERRLDAAAAHMRHAGWVVAWDGRHAGGYPFRLDLDFTNLRVADPSGWAVATTSLKTEAYAFAPIHWVFFAPAGLGFVRPENGAVSVKAKALRGSIDVSEELPRLSLEGDDLVFTPALGAKPFALASAANVQAYTRAGPGHQEAAFASVTGGVANPVGWLGAVAGPGPVTAKVDGVVSHTQYLRGHNWRSAIAAWSAGGGTFDVHDFEVAAGGVAVAAKGGGVAVGNDGRIVGVLELTPQSLGALLRLAHPAGPTPPAVALSTGAAPNDLRLTFRDGGVWLGPLRVASAPRVY